MIVCCDHTPSFQKEYHVKRTACAFVVDTSCFGEMLACTALYVLVKLLHLPWDLINHTVNQKQYLVPVATLMSS